MTTTQLKENAKRKIDEMPEDEFIRFYANNFKLDNNMNLDTAAENENPFGPENPFFTIVTNYLRNYNFKCNIAGFYHLRTALIMGLTDKKYRTGMIKLYNEIAKYHDSTQTRVERSIRHAIESTYSLYGSLCTDFYSECPTNSEFIYTAWDALSILIKSNTLI